MYESSDAPPHPLKTVTHLAAEKLQKPILLVNHVEAELDEDDAGSRAAEDDEEDGEEGVHPPHSAPRGGRTLKWDSM